MINIRYGLIYKYTSKTTNLSYIGKCLNDNYKRRHERHKYYNDNKTHFGRAKLKYGYDDFILTIIEENIPEAKLSEREIYWIAYYDTFNNGYNSTKGGDGGNTYLKRSEEQMLITKQKISKANSGKNNGIAKNPHLVTGKNNPMYGKRPHNALNIKIQNVKTLEIKEFDRAYKVAQFLGRKSGSFVTKMIQKDLVVDDWKIIEKSVETNESIA